MKISDFFLTVQTLAYETFGSYDDFVLYRQSAIGNRVYVTHTAECRMPWIHNNP